jgi:hypothetical protein
MSADDWIAVADALPAAAGKYLVRAPGAGPEGTSTEAVLFLPGLGWHHIPPAWERAITHWKPLPEPLHP